jgi:hypothetical protein
MQVGTAGCEVKIRAQEQRTGTKTRWGAETGLRRAARGRKRDGMSSVDVVVLVQGSC